MTESHKGRTIQNNKEKKVEGKTRIPSDMKVETISSLSSTLSSSSSARISAHTHITGLGLDELGHVIKGTDGASVVASCGLVGQVQAREACGIVADLIQHQQMAGRALLLVGPPGTGTDVCFLWRVEVSCGSFFGEGPLLTDDFLVLFYYRQDRFGHGFGS